MPIETRRFLAESKAARDNAASARVRLATDVGERASIVVER